MSLLATSGGDVLMSWKLLGPWGPWLVMFFLVSFSICLSRRWFASRQCRKSYGTSFRNGWNPRGHILLRSYLQTYTQPRFSGVVYPFLMTMPVFVGHTQVCVCWSPPCLLVEPAIICMYLLIMIVSFFGVQTYII